MNSRLIVRNSFCERWFALILFGGSCSWMPSGILIYSQIKNRIKTNHSLFDSFVIVKLQWIWQVLIIMLEDSQNLSLSLKSSFVDHMVWKLFYFVSVTINAYIFHGNYLLCSYFKCVKVLTCFRKFVNIYLLSKQLHFHPFSVSFSIWLKKM